MRSSGEAGVRIARDAAADTFGRRIWWLVLLVAVAVAVLAWRLWSVQILHGAEKGGSALERRIASETILAGRGAVYDRNGFPLVRSEAAWHVGLRVGYFRRGSPTAILHAVLETVRRAWPQKTEPLDYEQVFAEPERYLDALLHECRKSDLLRVPGRSIRYEMYARLASLFDLGGRRGLVRALEAAPSGATLDEVLQRDEMGAAQTSAARATAVEKIATERRRFEQLCADVGSPVDRLVASIAGEMETVDRLTALAIEAATREIMQTEGRDETSAHHLAERRVGQDLPFRMRLLVRSIDRDAALRVFLREKDYPGFAVIEDRARVIEPGAPYHIVGRVNELSPERVQAARDAVTEPPPGASDEEGRRRWAWAEHVASLEAGTTIGISGIERACDASLRGTDGHQKVLRDFFGRPSKRLEYEPPVDGCDLTLTIDSDLQAEVEAILAEEFGPGHAGSAILMDAQNGAVLAMASVPAPRWDETREDLLARTDDPERSLLARTVRETAYPYPGSTFKIVGAIAALEEGIVDLDTTFHCYGYMHSPNSFRCEGNHDDIKLARAIEKSCNVYFYWVGEKLGGARLAEWARRFGYGRPTGIELYEDIGDVRDPKTKSPWVPGDARKLAIGQVNVEVTPLQVLRMACAIGNGGLLVRPHLVLRGGRYDSWLTPQPERLDAQPATVRALQGMLREVVQHGTAAGHGLERFDAAGKTGTAQTHRDAAKHAWFVGYAPSAHPEVGVVVQREMTEMHGGPGAAPVAARILDAYYSRRGDER